MFKRVLQSLSKSLGGKSSPKSQPPPSKSSGPLPSGSARQPAAPPASAPAAAPAPKSGVLTNLTKAAPAPAKSNASPEELCGITAKMNKEQIRAQLKLLYRRYNRGASSLNVKVRDEADKMLDAIVAVREKHFGEI